MSLRRVLRGVSGGLFVGLLAAGAPGCILGDDDSGSAKNDLTSVTARNRTLEFEGVVYVEPNTSDQDIFATVKKQTQTAFGPLRVAEIAAKSRELAEVDASTFVKRPVKVVDTKDKSSRDMIEVKYTYKDDAVVSTYYAGYSAVDLALMSPNYRQYVDRVMVECTPNDEEAREFMSSAWYVFDPTLPQCQDAIKKEATAIKADKKLLDDPKNQVTASEARRLYLPITARLGADRTNKGASYPEYDRLFSGGVQKDKLVLSMIFGEIDHDEAHNKLTDDTNWGELMTALELVIDERGEFEFAKGPDEIDLTRFQLTSGQYIDSPKFGDLVRLRSGKSTLGLSQADRDAVQEQFAQRIQRKWLSVEHPVRVTIGGGAPKDFTIQVLLYWGSGISTTPFRYATKHSDVFLYNGHSSIGYGPLDPKNFIGDDFAKSYQLFWIDGCVSYNYYNKDYIPLKEGGTKNLDLVVNGIEADAIGSGEANGRFLVKLLTGAASYKDLLVAAKKTEALRVVDGEIDNDFDPKRTKLTISDR